MVFTFLVGYNVLGSGVTVSWVSFHHYTPFLAGKWTSWKWKMITENGNRKRKWKRKQN